MRSYVYPLDGVRFFAAFLVMIFHLGFAAWATPDSDVQRMFAHATSFPELTPITYFGWIGVQIFFVVSGFVIVNSADNAAPISFVKSRALRLYPAAWICSVITLSAWAISGAQPLHVSIEEFLRSISLFIVGPWIDGVYWTLAVEILFYALIFIVL